jgi:zinc transport system ATP-binding protein
MSIEAVSVSSLSFRYNGSEALRDLTFGVPAGDYIGLVGPNGSGKTTLIKAILGLCRPSAGSVSLFGTDIAHFTQWHRVGYLPQKLSSAVPYFPATVREIVGLGLLSRKHTREGRPGSSVNTIDRVLGLLEIGDLGNRLIGELSGGQHQRVLLARALVNEPDLLILDEPTAALDPETRDRFFEVLHDLNVNRETTVILVTHDIGTIGRYSTRLMYLDKRIIFYGTYDDFCRSEDMTSFFGKSSQHLICHRHDSDPWIP